MKFWEEIHEFHFVCFVRYVCRKIQANRFLETCFFQEMSTVLRRPVDPEEELRSMAKEVRDYVEAVLNSLCANIPKVSILILLQHLTLRFHFVAVCNQDHSFLSSSGGVFESGSHWKAGVQISHFYIEF